VLAIDPTADRSRAIAVGCAIQIGDMSKAQQLNTNYALKGGRWQRWANGKNDVSHERHTARDRGICFYNKNIQLFQRLHGFHLVMTFLADDWPLYSKLMQTTNANTK